MFLGQIERRLEERKRLIQLIVQLKSERRPGALREGKMIGLRVPDDLRARLDKAAEAHSAGNYTATLMLAIRLGLHYLEVSGGSPAVGTDTQGEHESHETD